MRNGDDGWPGAGGGAVAIGAPARLSLPALIVPWRDRAIRTLQLAALLAAAWFLSPPLAPLPGWAAPPLAGAEWEEARAQSIAPLAYGATTGRRMAAGALVRPLAETPERPEVSLSATVGAGDTLAQVLQRAGVGGNEANRAAATLRPATDPDALAPGTQIALTLGRRPSRVQPRPLEKLAFRAAFDLNLSLRRAGGDFLLDRQAIAIDRTPLRVAAAVGAGIYRSAEAAGVPARLVEQYLKALSGRMSLTGLRASDRFEIVADRARAATGEVELGDLQLAGLIRDGKAVRLVRWPADNQSDAEGEAAASSFVDATGRASSSTGMATPVAGRISSSFGWRTHPLLGYLRLHKGLDIAAAYGSPIYAAVDGRVASAGWAGGYGRFVKLAHAAGYASGYGHMSRIAVRPGQQVRRGQVIGYVGSTGLSTGPHLHWEVWRNGTAVNPRKVAAVFAAPISAETRAAIRAKAAQLLGTTLR